MPISNRLSEIENRSSSPSRDERSTLENASQEVCSKVEQLLKTKLLSDEQFESARLFLRKKSQEDLWFFAYHCCGWKDINNRLHIEMSQRWQKRRSRRTTLWLIPRSHLKTSLWTVAGTLWEKIQDTVVEPGGRIRKGIDLRFLIVNAKLDNAKAILKDIRTIVETNEFFGWLFPEFVPNDTWRAGRGRGKWTDERLDFPCSSRAGRKEGDIEIMSVGASLVSKHYDVMIFDDPVNEENTTTREYRDKLWSWYRNALQLKDARQFSRVRIIGTRWHFDDMYSRLINQEYTKRKRMQEEGIPVRPQLLIYRRKAIEDGFPIWPERFRTEDLEAIKEEIGSYIYSCQYDNDPLPEEDAYFKRNDIKTFTSLEIPERVISVGALDMADEESTRGDFTVFTVASFDYQGNMIAREVYRGKYGTEETLQIIWRMTQKWQLIRVGVETVCFQKTIYRNYRQLAHERGWYIPFVEMTRGKTSKIRRGLAFQPRVERGQFGFEIGMQYAEQMIEELVTFPLGVHDDIADTLFDCEALYYRAPAEVQEEKPRDLTYEAIYGSLDRLLGLEDEEEGLPVSYLSG